MSGPIRHGEADRIPGAAPGVPKGLRMGIVTDRQDHAPDEQALRRRAMWLLVEHKAEIEKGLRKAGIARDIADDAIAELLLRFMRGGGIVPYLRADPARDLTGLLVSQARWMVREVLKERSSHKEVGLEDFGDLDVDAARDEGDAAYGALARSVAAGLVAITHPTPSNLPREELLHHLNYLLARGDMAWSELTSDGVLNRARWTEHQKWTAIGMMWGFPVKGIAVVRYLYVERDPALLADPDSTRRMMRRVRRKGRELLLAKPREFRREHDLPLEAALPGEPGPDEEEDG